MAQHFPKDRFDVVPTDLERVGAHRAPRRRGQGLLWLVWCLVAVLIIVGVGWIYLRVLDDNVGGSSSPQPTVTETATPKGTATHKPTPTATATPTPTATVVPGAQISVLNGAGRAGLAAGAAAKLNGAGWTTVSTGNAPQSVPTTTVYYADPSQRGAALGVAQAIGVSTVTQSSQFAGSGAVVTVVLGADYAG